MKFRKFLALIPAIFMLAGCNSDPDKHDVALGEIFNNTNLSRNVKTTFTSVDLDADDAQPTTATYIIDGDKYQVNFSTGQSIYIYKDVTDQKYYYVFPDTETPGHYFKTDIDSGTATVIDNRYSLAGQDRKFDLKDNVFTIKKGESVVIESSREVYNWDKEDFEDAKVTNTFTQITIEFNEDKCITKYVFDLAEVCDYPDTDDYYDHYEITFEYGGQSVTIPDAEYIEM